MTNHNIADQPTTLPPGQADPGHVAAEHMRERTPVRERRSAGRSVGMRRIGGRRR